MNRTAQDIVSGYTYYSPVAFWSKGWSDRMNGYQQTDYHASKKDWEGLPSFTNMAISDYTAGWSMADDEIRSLWSKRAEASFAILSYP